MCWQLEVLSWSYDRKKIDALLAEGWEPFAATGKGDSAFVWLRRR